MQFPVRRKVKVTMRRAVQRLIAWAKDFLDRSVPLASGSWSAWQGGELVLADPRQIVGRAGANWLLRHHGLHIEIVIDPAHPVGRTDPAGIADVVLRIGALDHRRFGGLGRGGRCRREVAAYANWLGLMRGTLEATFEKSVAPSNARSPPIASTSRRTADPSPCPGRATLLARTSVI
jgi:malate synthase